MSAEDTGIERDLEKLRRDGSVVARFDTAEDAGAWRTDIRRACRAAGLRIRTGFANADDRIAWVYHLDHLVTEAAERAARRAMEDGLDRTWPDLELAAIGKQGHEWPGPDAIAFHCQKGTAAPEDQHVHTPYLLAALSVSVQSVNVKFGERRRRRNPLASRRQSWSMP